MSAAQRVDRLERLAPSAAGGCPHCPPAAFAWEDGPDQAAAPVCDACGRPVGVAVVFGYDDAPDASQAGAHETE